MKKGILFLLLVLCFTSCKHTWDSEDIAAFKEACMDDAKKWASSPEVAKTYCDCVFEQVEKKYPRESDALEHINEISKDSSLYRCREEATKNVLAK
ncbi:MAG: hypothetical protein JWQ38_2208 [Flavipsychrobacter sp.]|nr:hypothetical protein [Flavipsychrobacter sp.]